MCAICGPLIETSVGTAIFRKRKKEPALLAGQCPEKGGRLLHPRSASQATHRPIRRSVGSVVLQPSGLVHCMVPRSLVCQSRPPAGAARAGTQLPTMPPVRDDCHFPSLGLASSPGRAYRAAGKARRPLHLGQCFHQGALQASQLPTISSAWPETKAQPNAVDMNQSDMHNHD